MIHLFGIRHHGPGSARSVLAVLAQCQPAAILIEGPADAQPLLAQVDRDDLALPIALMLHSAEKDDSAPAAAFYPFAEYSPEWQALRHGQRHGIPVQFFDLPVGHRMALENQSVPGGEPDDPSTGATETTAVLDPDALARQALRDDLYRSLRLLTSDVLSTTSAEQDAQAKIEQWEKENKSRLARARRTLGEISRVSVTDLAELSVAAREIRSMIR